MISFFPQSYNRCGGRKSKTMWIDRKKEERLGQREENRPFPSSKNSYFQNMANYVTFLVKMSCLHENEWLLTGLFISYVHEYLPLHAEDNLTAWTAWLS